MRPRGIVLFWAMMTAIIAALSLGLSLAHVLEAPSRLLTWSPELWREATVFNGQYRLFGILGAPLDIAAIVCPAILAYLLRGQGGPSRLAAFAALFYAVALTLWFWRVAPANEVLATWTQGPIPADFETVRMRWETGHMAVAASKFVGLLLASASSVLADRFRDRAG
jgi:hypothetical protein